MMRRTHKIVKLMKTEVFYEVQNEFGSQTIYRFSDWNEPNIKVIDPPRPLTPVELSILNSVLSKCEDDLEGA